MARSTTSRRATAPPRRRPAQRAPGAARQMPGIGPAASIGSGPAGLATLSLMADASRPAAMAEPSETATQARASPAPREAQTPAEQTAAPAQAEVANDAGRAESLAEAEGVAPSEAPPAETTEAEVASPDAAATGEAHSGPTPPGETPAPEAPPEPSPEAAVAPAARKVGKQATKSATNQGSDAATHGAIKASTRAQAAQERDAEATGIRGADEAKTGKIETGDFEAALRRAIDEAIPEPKTEAQAKDVMRNGGERAAAKMQTEMADQKAGAVGALPASTTDEAVPDPSTRPAPEEVELVPEEVGPEPEAIGAGPVVPPASTDAAIDVSANREGVDQLQAENNITQSQLEKGNDPQFAATLGARGEAEKHDREAPKKLREAEAKDRSATRGQAQGAINTGLTDFHVERATRLNAVAGQQTNTKGLTEARKQEITSEIAAITAQTRSDVADILKAMDDMVAKDFGDAINKALEAYDDAFTEEKGGVLTRLGDILTGDLLGSERLESALRKGRSAFNEYISAAITDIAGKVETKLQEARDRVKQGRDEVDEYMTTKLDDAEREFADQAAGPITADFDALEGEISDRKDALVSKMVDMYKDGIERRNAREEELREANKSIWQRAWDATVGVIQKVIEFKNMLLGILARAAAVVEAIIQDPIGFLKNLIAGIGAGLERFMANIVPNLKQALMGWLFGALEGAGLKLPQTFDLMGFLDLVLQVLGLTKENIRARAVRLLGEETVAAIEAAADFIRVLFTDGPAAVWDMLLQKLGDIKEMIMAEIRSWIISQVIEAGIKWVLGLLNPAGAFVKACMMIYDIVVFFIERGRQIIEAVNAIINTLSAIVAGNISAMAQAVEGALNRILPVVISFLASLLGLGGISDTIRNFIEAVQAPVNAAIDWVIEQGVAFAKKVGGLFGGKEDEEQEQAADPETQAKIDEGLTSLKAENARVLDAGALSVEEAEGVAASVRAAHPVFTSINVVTDGDTIDYVWSANPTGETKGGDNEDEPIVKPLSLSRGSFNESTKRALAERFPDEHQGDTTNLLAGLDRRHEVSSQNFIREIKVALEGKTHSQAKDRLDQAHNELGDKRGSKDIKVELQGDANADQATIQEHAKRWYRALFNDIDNLWPGPSSPNRSLGDAPDPAPSRSRRVARQIERRHANTLAAYEEHLARDDD